MEGFSLRVLRNRTGMPRDLSAFLAQKAKRVMTNLACLVKMEVFTAQSSAHFNKLRGYTEKLNFNAAH